MQQFNSFREFYPYYLAEHENKASRRLHFIGTSLVILTLLYVALTQHWWVLLLAPVFGYGFAWAGHFYFEKNKPATFKYPLYSLMGDWVMFKDILLGTVKIF